MHPVQRQIASARPAKRVYLLRTICGYSTVARQEASGAKTPILLLDHAHLYLVLTGIMSLADVVERLRRHASQTGEAYLPANEFSG